VPTSLQSCRKGVVVAVCICATTCPALSSPAETAAKSFPWSASTLSPGERASLVLKEMTLDEKIALVHGHGMPGERTGLSASNGGAGFSVGVPRLGIPMIQMADAAYGVTRSEPNGRYSTALPSSLGAASSWDPQSAYEYGALIATELRAQGYNMSLGGGTNLTREPRSGRTFEYMGEDPVLSGTLDGNVMRGEQDQHVIGDIKHYAINDQENGRNAVNANIDRRSMRESDLLAFEIALDTSHAAAVMCSYNRVNGDYACENQYLLKDVLKKDFNFQGFVVSDWGGTHSATKASHAGLDMEQPDEFYYGRELKKAVESGKVSKTELDDHVFRILRAEFAEGLVDFPIEKKVVDVDHGFKVAQHLAEKSIVLLQNRNGILPLDPEKKQTIALIGGHADVGVLSGGGSAQVDSPGGSPVPPPPIGTGPFDALIRPAWLRDAPWPAIQAAFPKAKVIYNSGDDPAAAAALARTADAVIVFGYQWESETKDLETLSLETKQNTLIETVAAASPHTIVVLETGSPATMPWAGKVSAILEAWYPGIRGAEALAGILSGVVNPTGKLAVTFPINDADLPHPRLVKPPDASELKMKSSLTQLMAEMGEGLPAFQTYYDEKLKVGYKWYDAEKKEVLFPFGYGLSYTTYSYSSLELKPGDTLSASFTVKNTGQRAGEEIAQVYASLPDSAGEPPRRLVGWAKLPLAAGESRQATVQIDRKMLEVFDEETDSWKLIPGTYTLSAGSSSRDLPLQKTIQLP
jgi:beta-glucosidase